MTANPKKIHRGTSRLSDQQPSQTRPRIGPREHLTTHTDPGIAMLLGCESVAGSGLESAANRTRSTAPIRRAVAHPVKLAQLRVGFPNSEPPGIFSLFSCSATESLLLRYGENQSLAQGRDEDSKCRSDLRCDRGECIACPPFAQIAKDRPPAVVMVSARSKATSPTWGKGGPPAQ